MSKENNIRDMYHLSDFHQKYSVGRYNIPRIKREYFIPPRFIDFSQALTSKDYESGVHLSAY